MKKVATILALLSFLVTAQGCDFIRVIAGRPTEAQVREMANNIEQRKQQIRDSLEQLRVLALERQALQRDSAIRDSISTELEIKFSDIFRFGEPQSQDLRKYNVIIGVYRKEETANKQISTVSAQGFTPFLITFPAGEIAVCLGAADDVHELCYIISSGRQANACPKDAWIYMNNVK